MSSSYTAAPVRPTTRTGHQTICDDCGMSTTVPFRPTQGKPVYCQPCFKSRRQGLHSTMNASISTNPSQPRTHNEQSVDTAPPALTPPTDFADDLLFSEMPLKPATKAAISWMNITEPTPIQQKAIPHLMGGRDLIGQARTGSGKTLAFAVPLTERCDPKVQRIQALVLVPTRELAIQVAGVIEALASSNKLRVTLLYGGRSLKPEHTALKRGTQVVIGTPGRTLDHLRQGSLDLRSVQFLVLGRSRRDAG